MSRTSPLSDLVETSGRDHARAFWEGGRAAIQTIGDTVAREEIGCEFSWVPGYLHSPIVEEPNSDDTATLRADADLAVDLGFSAAFLESAPFVNRPAIRFDRQARFEPLRYAHALVDLIGGDGSEVFEGSPVTEITGDDAPIVMVNGYRLECQDVVIATHLPTVAQPALVRAAWSESALALFTSYVIAAEVPRGAAPTCSSGTPGDPYRYLRVVPGRSSDVLIFGGHDHRSDEHVDPDERYAELERDLNGVLPDARVLNRWRGEVIISADGLPIIGYPAPHQFVATGFNGNGITLGTLAAMMAADALTGRRNPWCELFAADRPALREPVGHSLQGGA